jgi:hypothetical protein
MGSCCDGMDARGPLRGELMLGQEDNAAAGWAAEQAGVPNRRGLPRQPVVPPVAEPANEAQTPSNRIRAGPLVADCCGLAQHPSWTLFGRRPNRYAAEAGRETTAHRGRISSGTLSAGVLAEAV